MSLATPPLTEHVVHAWLLPLSGELSTALLAYITPEEKNRAATMQSEQRKKEWLATRALLRACLSHYTGISPVDLRFEKTEAGKPILINAASEIAFNLSHGPRWAVCAVAAAGDVGVDVDCETRRNRIDDIAAQYFHAQEQAVLVAIQDEHARRRAFFRYWTLKEAYIKAKGETLNGTRLQEYAFLPSVHQQPATLLNATSDGWQFAHRRFDDDHHLALASQCEKSNTDDGSSVMQYSFWQWDPVLNALQTLTTCES